MNPENPAPKVVRVYLGERSYNVVIGRGLLFFQIDDLFNQMEPYKSRSSPRVALIADKNIRGGWGDLKPMMDFAVVEHNTYWVDAGETSKSLEQCGAILRWMAFEKFTRSDLVIAVGGGVIGDLAGFVAATYLRGIDFVQVPTTLLAMVDSSVGGKTGVNLPEGKNLVGVFHQPKLVIADLDTLSTLPAREFAAGMAEVIKYGCIVEGSLNGEAFFNRIAAGVKPDDADLADIVAHCIEIKARIVERDEFETKGERALLNFGHTLGHAIEKAGEYKRYLHGEAVALGLRAAAWLSVWQQGLPETKAREIEAVLSRNHLPVQIDPALDAAVIHSALGHDKKIGADGGNRWVLLESIGHARSGLIVPDDLVRQAIELLYRPPSA